MQKYLSLFVLILAHTGAFAQLNPSVQPPAVYSPFRKPVTDAKPRKSIEQIIRENKNGLPNIVLIGYWPPTNEMIREFSPHEEQNPQGWVGKNWEGRGYNIYGFFPDFPDSLGKGEGDFQVDYQGTSKSFYEIVPPFKPVALLSFGRANSNLDWEIELITRNLSDWIADFLDPLLPNPSPPDASMTANQARSSRFPGQLIVNALKTSTPSINAFVDDTGAGAYLCEYLGFHLSWYRELNPLQVRYAAHTHIGSATPLPELKTAAKVALRTLIENLDAQD